MKIKSEPDLLVRESSQGADEPMNGHCAEERNSSLVKAEAWPVPLPDPIVASSSHGGIHPGHQVNGEDESSSDSDEDDDGIEEGCSGETDEDDSDFEDGLDAPVKPDVGAGEVAPARTKAKMLHPPAMPLDPIVDVDLPDDNAAAGKYVDRVLNGLSGLLGDVPQASKIIARQLGVKARCVSFPCDWVSM
jgi:hypothetical protein